MAKDQIKKFRLNEIQVEQLNKYLINKNMNFSKFMHSLISKELLRDVATVQVITEEQDAEKEKIIVKTKIEIVKRYQHTDPQILLELSKLGNNINQIARALNIIKNAHQHEQSQLDLFQLLITLKSIQNELEQLFPQLPKISRTTDANFTRQLEKITEN